MMQISETIYEEADFFLLAIACGAFLICLYDFFRIIRRLTRHSVAALAVEDLFYWIVVFAIIFYLLYEKNDGMVRLFFLLGVGAGMLCYNRFISPKTVGGIVWTLQKAGTVLQQLLSFFFKPVLFLHKKIRAGYKLLQKRRKKRDRMRKKQLKK